ncbi:hypothetical protein KP509_07G083900 [Ceratopteris richardii]|uniref:Glycosyl transferase 48 domain-containing protein n=1 Tax=Ceratopteris richardii TaxID=49495 RepID=A0A8T2UGG9_CERRI|nr:hypothetical protein KP509_07G083900 [Ceratopteris richardii]
MFEAKVSSGNAEQLLSRDVFRLGNSFDIFRLLSFYVTSVGYYACTMMTSLTIYVFLYGKAYLALSGLWRIFDDLALRNHDKPLQTALGTQFLFQIGFFTAIPMLVMFMIEEGFIKAVVNIVVMQLQLSSVFFTFSLGTRSHYFSRTVLQGGAKYQDTGRNFVVQHIKFAQNYRLYSRSHFVNAFEIMMLLIVIRVYGPQKSPQSYILFSFFCWFLAISWLFAPFIFNPSGFEWQKTVEDYNNWVKWLLGRDNFDPNAKDCWENWWMEQQASNASIMSILLRTALSLRFLFPQFGIIYHLEKVKNDTSILIYGISWLIFIGIIMLFLTFSYRSNYPGSMRPIRGVLYMILFVSFVMVEVLGIISINDIFATIFALIPTGWGLLCIAMIWSEYIQQSPIKPIWSIVKATAWYYDAAMGMLIFIPIAVLSWFQFVSIFQTRLLFNQAFSRGLEISRILSARKQQDDEGSTAKIK